MSGFLAQTAGEQRQYGSSEDTDDSDSYLNKGKLKDAEALLLLSLQDVEEEGLYGARLTLLYELEGLYRTTGRARQAMEISEKALALISVLGLTGQEPSCRYIAKWSHGLPGSRRK